MKKALLLLLCGTLAFCSCQKQHTSEDISTPNTPVAEATESIAQTSSEAPETSQTFVETTAEMPETSTVMTDVTTTVKKESLSDYELSLIKQLIWVLDGRATSITDCISMVGEMSDIEYLMDGVERIVPYKEEMIKGITLHQISENDMREAVKYLFGKELPIYVSFDDGLSINMGNMHSVPSQTENYYFAPGSGKGNYGEVEIRSYEIENGICDIDYTINYFWTYEENITNTPSEKKHGEISFKRTSSKKYPWQYYEDEKSSSAFPQTLLSGYWVQYDTDHGVGYIYSFGEDRYSRSQGSLFIPNNGNPILSITNSSSGSYSVDGQTIFLGEYTKWYYDSASGAVYFGEAPAFKVYHYLEMPNAEQIEADFENLSDAKLTYWQRKQEEEKKKQESMSKKIDLSALLCEGYWVQYATQFYGGDMYRFYPDGTCDYYSVSLDGNGNIYKSNKKESYSIDVNTYHVDPESGSWYYNSDEEYMYQTIGGLGGTATMRVFHYDEIPSFEQMKEDAANKWIK